MMSVSEIIKEVEIMKEAEKPSGKMISTKDRRRLAARYIRQDPILCRSLIAILEAGEFPTAQMRFSISLWLRELKGEG